MNRAIAVFDKAVRKLAEGADVLIYDAQYRPEEYAARRRGWGHSHWQEGVSIAKQSDVKHLVLYHHDPDHSDDDDRRNRPASAAALSSGDGSQRGAGIAALTVPISVPLGCDSAEIHSLVRQSHGNVVNRIYSAAYTLSAPLETALQALRASLGAAGQALSQNPGI